MRPVAHVLGTPVFAAGDDDRDRALLVSDLHVPDGGGAVVERLAAVLALATAAARRSRVFLLGDLFDSYVSPAQLRVGVWREVAGLLRRAADAGVAVTVLHGNRDFLLGPEFVRAAGARLIPGGVSCRFGGRAALLLHGDELCINDLPYQRAKRWLRAPWTRFVARRLPLSLALRVARQARQRSMRTIQQGDQTRFLPTPGAVAAALAGHDLLVFGHIHRLAQGRSGTGEYRVLPAFDRDGVLLRADADTLDYGTIADGFRPLAAGRVAELWDRAGRQAAGSGGGG